MDESQGPTHRLCPHLAGWTRLGLPWREEVARLPLHIQSPWMPKHTKVPVHRKRIIPSPHCVKLAHQDQLYKAPHRQGEREQVKWRKERTEREEGREGGRKNSREPLGSILTNSSMSFSCCSAETTFCLLSSLR